MGHAPLVNPNIMLVTASELGQTDLYPEIIDKITRGNATEVEIQLATAEDVVKGYMGKYDLVAIFGQGTTLPTVESLSIKKIIKTLATWYLLKRANPNVNTELVYDDYKVAVRWLEDLQAGKINLALPYAPVSDPASIEAGISFNSLPKQRNFF
jgi:phage gp36-like protein